MGPVFVLAPIVGTSPRGPHLRVGVGAAGARAGGAGRHAEASPETEEVSVLLSRLPGLSGPTFPERLCHATMNYLVCRRATNLYSASFCPSQSFTVSKQGEGR